MGNVVASVFVSEGSATTTEHRHSDQTIATGPTHRSVLRQRAYAGPRLRMSSIRAARRRRTLRPQNAEEAFRGGLYRVKAMMPLVCYSNTEAIFCCLQSVTTARSPYQDHRNHSVTTCRHVGPRAPPRRWRVASWRTTQRSSSSASVRPSRGSRRRSASDQTDRKTGTPSSA